MESLEEKVLKTSKRIVIKVGSALLIGNDLNLINNLTLTRIASEIIKFKKLGKEILLVSSGALALGKKSLKIKKNNLKISEKQAASSVGQVLLINAWKKAFLNYKKQCGQILLTHLDAEIRSSAINARNTIESLIKLNTIPIINENDTVATKELRYGDNDQLAARVAQITSSDLLILLSDVDGLHTSNPKSNKNAELIKYIKKITKAIEKYSGDTSSSVAVGGMQTKIKAAKIAMSAGCNMIITRGNKISPISSILKNGNFSLFLTSTNPNTARKKWISSQVKIKGEIIIDKGAENALRKGASLLPAGILSISGTFYKGDIINVLNENKKIVCVGISAYPSKDAKIIAGAKSNEIQKLLGYHSKDVIIHRDDMVLRN
jgi:glutamate 5-kinase